MSDLVRNFDGNWTGRALAARAAAEEPVREAYRAMVRDAAQDELDRIQAETGVHAECGRPVADHCTYCDICDCKCPADDKIGAFAPVSHVSMRDMAAEDAAQRRAETATRVTTEPMSAAGLLNAMIAYVVDCNPGGKTLHVADLMVHMAAVARGLSEDAATEWLAEEMEERFIAQAD